MVKQKTKLILISAMLIMVIALVPLLAACAKEAPPPVGKAAVKIGFVLPYTGAIAMLCPAMEAGFVDYIRYANEEELVPGVTFEPVIEDTRYTPEGCAAAYRRARARGVPFIFSIIGSDNEYIAPFAEDDDFFIFGTTATVKTVCPHGATYVHSLGHAGAAIAYVDWVCQNWDYEAKGRPPRIAVISTDNPVGHCPEDAAVYVSGAYDVEYGPFVYTGMAPTDFTAELTRIAAAGADYVFISQGPGGTIVCLKDLVRMGFREQIEPGLSSMNTILLITTKIPELVDGITGAQFYTYLGGPEPGSIKCREIQARYHPDKIDVDYLYALGWAPAMPVVEIYKRAIEKVGVKDLDNKACLDALVTIDNFDTGGLLPPLSWVGEDVRIGCYETCAWHFGSDGHPESTTWHPGPHEYEAYACKP